MPSRSTDRSYSDLCLSDAVAGPDGEDATLLPKPFQSFETSAERSTEKRKIIVGLPDVSRILPR